MALPPTRRVKLRSWHLGRERAAVLALLLLGAALRLLGAGAIPPGLYHDEAQHGLDALRVLEAISLRQPLPLYFAANNGREPAFIYLVTASVAILGRTPLAVRLPATFAGVLTLAAMYDLAVVLFGGPAWSQTMARRAARYALATLAVTFWHVHLSRVGFRAVLLPLFTALYLAQAVRAVRSGRIRHWIAAGALYGASWYTYMAARFTPVAIAAVLAFAALDRWRQRRQSSTAADPKLGQLKGAILGMAAALIVLLPLGLYTLAHPDIVLARTGQVSIFSETVHQGQFWRTLGRYAWRTAEMFTVRGDRIWRHNLAWRPVWDPALGLAFFIGLGVCLAGTWSQTWFRREGTLALRLILVWTGVMALPTLLAEDAPHFLRAVGMLPTAALIPAIGLAWLADTIRRAVHRARWTALVPWLLLSAGLLTTTYDYFVRYPASAPAYFWFEGGAVDLAARLNRLRGVGWDGIGIQRVEAEAIAPTLHIDRQLWDEWSALPFLIEKTPARAEVRLSDEMNLQQESASANPVGNIYAVWPYRNWEPDVLPALAHPAYLQVYEGPQAQGDQDPEPFTTALIIAAVERPPVLDPVARFESGIVLRGALVAAGEPGRPGSAETELRLWWDAIEPVAHDYTVFVHYQRDGARIAQHDGQPGLGHLRTTFWQPGDLILDIHPLGEIQPAPSRDTMRLGLYDADTGQGLRLLAADGAPTDETALELPVILAEGP